jgi:DNA (cytosine-5)-methyltransferase 1
MAGFHVTGVDLDPQPFYVGDEFHQADAMTFPLEGFDVIHASPPCQAFTSMSNRWRGRGGKADDRIDLLTPTLERFRGLRVPWVVENVLGARNHMRTTLLLHGGMFGLKVHRPRLFESNMLLMAPEAKAVRHPLGVYGTFDGRRLFTRADGTTQHAAVSLEEAQAAMGMDWADWHGTKEAVPPAYTEHIGRQLIAQLETSAA